MITVGAWKDLPGTWEVCENSSSNGLYACAYYSGVFKLHIRVVKVHSDPEGKQWWRDLDDVELTRWIGVQTGTKYKYCVSDADLAEFILLL